MLIFSWGCMLPRLASLICNQTEVGSIPITSTTIGITLRVSRTVCKTEPHGVRVSSIPQILGVINLRLTGSKLSIDSSVVGTLGR